ncbi:hypothetical protein CO151_11885, partial [bacterium CG_4_9_14_3_um_filter_65_15]
VNCKQLAGNILRGTTHLFQAFTQVRPDLGVQGLLGRGRGGRAQVPSGANRLSMTSSAWFSRFTVRQVSDNFR